MNSKFTDLIKGRNDGAEILKAMMIFDSTKATKKVLDGLSECLRLVDSGLPVNEAAEQVLGMTKKHSTNEIASTLRDRADQTSAQISNQINQVDQQIQRDAVNAYVAALTEGLEFHLSNNTAQSTIGEVIDLGEFSIVEQMKTLPPRSIEPKALPSSSDTK